MKNSKLLVAGAIISGLIAGQNALAGEHGKPSNKAATKNAKPHNGDAKAKDAAHAKDKAHCKGADHCEGKDGCGKDTCENKE